MRQAERGRPGDRAARVVHAKAHPGEINFATGGNGANNHLELLPVLLKHAANLQVIVICGRNHQAYNDTVHWRANHPELPCYIEGFSEIVHLLMQASDAIVTRGGTTTCAKALHFRCPIIFNAVGRSYCAGLRRMCVLPTVYGNSARIPACCAA